MLAHLRAYTSDVEETNRIKRLYSFNDDSHLKGILAGLQIAQYVPGQLKLVFNPPAVPMVKRYIQIFEAYEKQNGL